MDGATKSSADATEVHSTPLEGGIPTLRDLSLLPVPNWYLLGLQLGVSGDELDVIERNYPRDNHICKVKMFGTWLRMDASASYSKLARALVAVGNRNIAEAMCSTRGILLTVPGGSPTPALDYSVMEAAGHSIGGESLTPSRTLAHKHEAAMAQVPVLTATQQAPPCPQRWPETQMSSLPPLSSAIRDHDSPLRLSLEPALVHGVASSSPHLLSQAHSAQERSRAAVFARENQQAIKDKFADFQTKVCDKLVKNGVDTQQVRLFVTNQFPPGDCIPPAPASLTEIFEAITHHRLWNYFHYSPLLRIAKKFGANDVAIEGWVQTYKQDLKAYSLVTTVEDYIEADLDVADTPLTSCAKNDPRYCTPVEWKTNFIDHSLQYLTEVWELFSSHYLMPDSPPTALLDRVRMGCFSVTWLVPSGLITLLIKQVKIDTKFFKEHHILKVTVGDECIYEELIEESTVPKCSEGGAEPHGQPQQEETFGGYDCEFVEPPPNAFQTECPICSLILRNPYLTNCCGTSFCHTCSERIQDEHKPCPTCREDNFEVFPNKGLKRSLNQLYVLCIHSKDGCDWSGELGELQHHLNKVDHSDVLALPTPTPSSFKKIAPLTKESEAFQNCFADLIKKIQDPELLAWELYSGNVILKKQVEGMSVAGLTVVQRKTRLLSMVEDQIAVDPSNFQKVLKVLRKQPPLKDVVNELRATYKSYVKVGDTGKRMKVAVVLYKYEKQRDDELSLEVGDVITDVKQIGNSWYEGVLKCRRGMFRDNYVQFSRVAVVSYEYEKQRDDELSLEVGDVITDVKQIEEGWSEGVLNGRRGMFPDNYVQFSRDAQESNDPVPPHAPDSKSMLLHPHSRLKWRRAADLPVAMTNHHIVRIGTIIYSGGGYTGNSDTARQVFQYNSNQDTWSQLPICPTRHFGLIELNGKLVTVGGSQIDCLIPINDVYVFQKSETWENSIIPPLPTARFYPTAFNYESTLVVSGGITHWQTLSNDRTYTNAVEIFQSKTYQWYRAEPLPVAHNGMSCAIIDDMCYLIGGTEYDGYPSIHPYCASVSSLISRALPSKHPETSIIPQASPSPPIWQVLPKCPLEYCTATELQGCFLAIGGRDDSKSPSSAVHMYSPSSNLWVRISNRDLPVPRFRAAATQLKEGEVIFVGGNIKRGFPTKTVFIASIEH